MQVLVKVAAANGLEGKKQSREGRKAEQADSHWKEVDQSYILSCGQGLGDDYTSSLAHTADHLVLAADMGVVSKERTVCTRQVGSLVELEAHSTSFQVKQADLRARAVIRSEVMMGAELVVGRSAAKKYRYELLRSSIPERG